MAAFKPFLLFLDTVSSADAFVENVEEYDNLEFRMEILESHLSRMMIVFNCIYHLPNVNRTQIERVSKVMTSLINLKTVTWIGKMLFLN